MKVGAVVLAAGGSSRLGEPKQLLKFRGQSLVRRVVQSALDAGCAPVAVVLGVESERILAELGGLAVALAPNDTWQRGIGSSIRRGLQALTQCDALVILACDQPHVNEEVIKRLIRTQEETQKAIIGCTYAGTIGVPALFMRAYFEKLAALDDASGAKSIIATQPDDVAQVAFPEGAIDIDTAGDYEALLKS